MNDILLQLGFSCANTGNSTSIEPVPVLQFPKYTCSLRWLMSITVLPNIAKCYDKTLAFAEKKVQRLKIPCQGPLERSSLKPNHWMTGVFCKLSVTLAWRRDQEILKSLKSSMLKCKVSKVREYLCNCTHHQGSPPVAWKELSPTSSIVGQRFLRRP